MATITVRYPGLTAHQHSTEQRFLSLSRAHSAEHYVATTPGIHMRRFLYAAVLCISAADLVFQLLARRHLTLSDKRRGSGLLSKTHNARFLWARWPRVFGHRRPSSHRARTCVTVLCTMLRGGGRGARGGVILLRTQAAFPSYRSPRAALKRSSHSDSVTRDSDLWR